jgi:putative hydrolase of the HAD superfamily
MLTPFEEMIKLVHDLKDRGYKVYVLSNFHVHAFERVYSKHSFFQLFDGMVISSTIKCCKPNAAIFQKLIEQYNLVPEEAVFVDDTKENVDAAMCLGFNAIQFIQPDEFIEDLKKIGGIGDKTLEKFKDKVDVR